MVSSECQRPGLPRMHIRRTLGWKSSWDSNQAPSMGSRRPREWLDPLCQGLTWCLSLWGERQVEKEERPPKRVQMLTYFPQIILSKIDVLNPTAGFSPNAAFSKIQVPIQLLELPVLS